MPFEKPTGPKPSLKYIRVFGCSAFVQNDTTKSKVHDTVQPGLLLEYDDHRACTAELLLSKKAVNAVHATFDETAFLGLENTDSSSSGEEGQWTAKGITDLDSCESSNESYDSDIFQIELEGSCTIIKSEFEATSPSNEASSK